MASKIIGSTIKNGANETIGDINDLMFDSNGNIKAVVAGIGGFLGLGEHRALLRFDQIQLNRDSNGRLFVLSQMTREQLKALPEWREPNEVVRSK